MRGGLNTTKNEKKDKDVRHVECNPPIALWLTNRYAVEEKYKAQAAHGEDDDSEAQSSEDETEDEEGFLATEELDAEISATLQAIKNRDPRIYDQGAKFFQSVDENAAAAPKEKKEKAMFLHDYHRERYMAGDTGADQEDAPKTFVQEQADLKKDILAEINAAADGDDEDEDGAFIKAKHSERTADNGIHPSRQERIKPKDLDVSLADKDPDLFLSNFMASRAWVPEDGSKWEAFESDDGEGNDDADEWEAAYNLRFEDPTKSNEVLTSYSRKIVEARSVRREDPKGRKRQRELEKEQKEEEKRQRHEERARLKRLKVEEAEEKLKKIKMAAGLRGEQLKDDEWMKLLEDAWENDKWEEEMSRRFGEQYYAEAEEGSDSEQEEGGSSKKNKKPKKPKWDDDIDIKDIIPDFEDEEAKPDISLSDGEEEEADEEAVGQDEEDAHTSKKRKTTKDHKADRAAAKRAARQEHSKIEALVDAHLEIDAPTVLATSKKNKATTPAAAAPFRYRETSPQSFGLTARDILLAPSDAALNEFAGLKKLATFRDAEKKKKDKKKLGKKARLREWRREVFGREFEHTGPTFGFGGKGDKDAEGKDEGVGAEAEASSSSKKKRKRTKSKKSAGAGS